MRRLALGNALVIGATGLVLTVLGTSPATAAKPRASATSNALRAPQRLTAGPSDQLLGTLSPDGNTLYFVSNQNATAQVFKQPMSGGAATLLFDDSADVSFPRVSPDGRRLLYISSRDDAGGDVCIRRLGVGTRRCFPTPTSAEVQALWFPDGKSVGVVGRKGLHGDLRLRRVPAGLLGGDGEIMVDSNLSGPAFSPDGQWLVWLPIKRASKRVGISFAMKATGGLAVRRVAGGKVQTVRLDLPGETGFATFSAGGRWLYFAQYLSDSDGDGHIDGDDNAVVFRTRFSGTKSNPLKGTAPEQLTSARWNCQYPQPSRNSLILTCNIDGGLDIYSLPLDGSVPATWKPKKLREALSSSRDAWQKLLILRHLLQRSRDPRTRRELLADMAFEHLRVGEHTSAQWAIDAIGREKAGKRAARWAQVARVLVQHRREERLLNRGELNERFIKAQRKHLWTLALLGRGAGTNIQALARMIMMEVHDVIGEKRRAKTTLAGLKLRKITDRFALRLYAERAAPFLGRIGDRKGQVEALTTLAGHERLTPEDRIEMTERLLKATCKGLPRKDRLARVKKLRKRVEVDSEAAFRLELQAKLLALRRFGPDHNKQADANAESVRKELFQHYRYHREFPRRKTLVRATMKAASRADSGYLMYQFANTWISMVSRKHAERPAAESLFRQVLLERAYIDWNKGKYGDARGNFYGITLQMVDLQAHTGFIDMRAREGKKDALTIYGKRYAETPDDPVWRFVQAYHAASSLANLDAEARQQAVARAMAHMDVAATALEGRAGYRLLRGYLLHQRFLATGEVKTAAEAHGHYLMGLDLAAGKPRYQAALLHAIGLLQGQVGNHFIALDYLDRRMKLPIRRPESQLSLHLARARSLYHAGRQVAAADEGEKAAALVADNPMLQRFEKLTTDRASFYAYTAGRFAKAAKGYARLAGALKGANLVRARMMAGAAKLGLADGPAATKLLGEAAKQLKDMDDDAFAAGRTPWRKVPATKAADMRLLVDGLRARALTLEKRYDEADAAHGRRIVALKARLEDGPNEKALVALATSYNARAEAALARGRKQQAKRWLEKGLQRADEHAKLTGTKNHRVRVRLGLSYASLVVHAGVDRKSLARDPAAILAPIYAAMCRRPNPARATERLAMKLYLALLH